MKKKNSQFYCDYDIILRFTVIMTMVVVVVTTWSASLFLLCRRCAHICFFSFSVLPFVVVESSRKKTFSTSIKRTSNGRIDRDEAIVFHGSRNCSSIMQM